MELRAGLFTPVVHDIRAIEAPNDMIDVRKRARPPTKDSTSIVAEKRAPRKIAQKPLVEAIQCLKPRLRKPTLKRAKPASVSSSGSKGSVVRLLRVRSCCRCDTQATTHVRVPCGHPYCLQCVTELGSVVTNLSACNVDECKAKLTCFCQLAIRST
jgi:hypothetical protein